MGCTKVILCVRGSNRRPSDGVVSYRTYTCMPHAQRHTITVFVQSCGVLHSVFRSRNMGQNSNWSSMQWRNVSQCQWRQNSRTFYIKFNAVILSRIGILCAFVQASHEESRWIWPVMTILFVLVMTFWNMRNEKSRALRFACCPTSKLAPLLEWILRWFVIRFILLVVMLLCWTCAWGGFAISSVL